MAWKEFRSGKRKKEDVQLFERNLADNLYELHLALKNKTYRHGHYSSFYINDPKLRNIQKAEVVDRILHHAIYRILYPIFDRTFCFDSYSCRLGKGTHKAVRKLDSFIRKISKNYSWECFALKCDVKKFFASVDHEILLEMIERKIKDRNVLRLLGEILASFPLDSPAARIERERESFCLRQKPLFSQTEIPIGNLTSQLFANIYLNELDKFIKHRLHLKYYVRYCDDFVILSRSYSEFNNLIPQIQNFLGSRLKLRLHENKVLIRRPRQGIDFLGYVILPNCIVLRTKMRKRMIKKVNVDNLASYSGILKHCKGYELEKKIVVLADLSEKVPK